MPMNSDAVEARNLVLGYGPKIALDTSTFTIPAGKITAIIGPNGSGKSTLLNAISGLLEPRSGSIDVAAPRQRISYVLQTTKVNESLPVTVIEVVTMGRYARTGIYRWITVSDREVVATAMDRLGISNIDGSHLNELSGGQRQRVFVAQGLAQDHDLLLLDEPLTGIDLPTAQAIDGVIHEEIELGCTVVLTTHDLSEAQVADNVVLVSGRVIAAGPPDQVLTPDNLRTAYGAALLHVEDGYVFLDDAAHSPVGGRHVHGDRIIHTETARTDVHRDE